MYSLKPSVKLCWNWLSTPVYTARPIAINRHGKKLYITRFSLSEKDRDDCGFYSGPVFRIAITWMIVRKMAPAAAINASARLAYRGIVKVS